MSKSKGLFIPLWKAISKYGADVTRLTLLMGAEDLDDPDWREVNAQANSRRLQSIWNLISELLEISREKPEKGYFEKLLLTKLAENIAKVDEFMSRMKTASAVRIIYFMMYDDLVEYKELADEIDRQTILSYIEAWTKFMSMFTPFLAEEIWSSLLKKESLVSLETWPEVPENYPETRIIEKYVKDLLDDVLSIMKVYPRKPKTVYLYTARKEKWIFVSKALKEGIDVREAIKSSGLGIDVIGHLVKFTKELKGFDKDIYMKTLDIIGSPERETEILNQIFSRYLKRSLNSDLIVYAEEKATYDPKLKAKKAIPLKPAIYVE